MHDEEGPRRLRQGTDTPETLVRALTALRKGVDDTARLERVGQKLEAVMTAPRAAETTVAAGRGLLGNKLGNKLSVLKLIVGGLGLLAPLLFFQFMDDDAVPQGPDAGSLQPTAALPKIEQNEPAQIEQPAESIQVAANLETELAARQPAPRASKPTHAASTRARKSQREVVSKSEERVEPDVAQESDKAASAERPVVATTTAGNDEPTSLPPTLKEKAPREAEPRADAPPPVSEASLLLEARKALKSDPASALRLATEHQARFATGRLTPEREVLAIEALRKLGRKLEADERLRKFEARYPGSIHLKRLHEAK